MSWHNKAWGVNSTSCHSSNNVVAYFQAEASVGIFVSAGNDSSGWVSSPWHKDVSLMDVKDPVVVHCDVLGSLDIKAELYEVEHCVAIQDYIVRLQNLNAPAQPVMDRTI